MRLHLRFSGFHESKQVYLLTATGQSEIIYMLQQLFRCRRWHLERWIVAMLAEQFIEVFVHQQRHIQFYDNLTITDVCKK